MERNRRGAKRRGKLIPSKHIRRSQSFMFSGFSGFTPPEDFGKIWGLGLTWWDWGDYNSIKGKDGESTAGAARSESRGRWEPAARCAGTWLRRLCARARVSVRRGVPLQAQPMVVGAEAREGGDSRVVPRSIYVPRVLARGVFTWKGAMHSWKNRSFISRRRSIIRPAT